MGVLIDPDILVAEPMGPSEPTVLIPYVEEAQASGNHEYSTKDAGGNSATRVFLIENYDNHQRFIRHFLGSVIPIGGSGSDQFERRWLGKPHPDRPWLYATRASVQGVGVASKSIRGGYTNTVARVTIHYEIIQQSKDDNGQELPTVLEEHRETVAKHYPLPQSKLRWLADPDPFVKKFAKGLIDGATMAKRILITNYTLTYKNWLTPPFDIAEDLVGCVNNRRMRWLFQSYEPDCVLFEGLSPSIEYTIEGVKTYTVALKFSIRKPEWNWQKLMNPFGYFQKVDGDLYDRKNLNVLLPGIIVQ